MTENQKTALNNLISMFGKPCNKKFMLGSYYTDGNRIGKLIKVTAKGYNILDESSNKCILRKHMYPKESDFISSDSFWLKCYGLINTFEYYNESQQANS